MSGKITLSFNKKIEKKVLKESVLKDASVKNVNTIEIIGCFDQTTKPTCDIVPDELVIPLIEVDRAAFFKKSDKKKEEAKLEEKNDTEEKKVLTLDEQAEAAIIEESRRKLEDWKEKGDTSNIAIKMENMMDTSTPINPAKESSLEDYDQVQVDAFGSAMLRGMGWKKDQGVGKNNKRLVEIIEPTSKSLARTEGQVNKVCEDEEEDLKNGSHVFIHSGRSCGTYGKVECIDEDHILIRLARTQNVVREVELNINVVSVQEYKDSSRVINKEMYDKYKEKDTQKKLKVKSEETLQSPANLKRNERESCISQLEERVHKNKSDKTSCVNLSECPPNGAHTSSENVIEKETKRSKGSHEVQRKFTLSAKCDHKTYNLQCNNSQNTTYKMQGDLNSKNSSDEKHDKKFNKTVYSKSKKLKIDSASTHSHADERNEPQYGEAELRRLKNSQEKLPPPPWVQENLKVRIISKTYKDGKYYKDKVLIKSVDTIMSCTCKTEIGKILYDVPINCLETVIPKERSVVVMVVNGPCRGQKGRIIDLDKNKGKAMLQLLEGDLRTFHFDDICEVIK